MHVSNLLPGHPQNVISTFEKVAENSNVRFFGNVTVDKDVTVEELRRMYSAVVFAYGADEDRTLGIPGGQKVWI